MIRFFLVALLLSSFTFAQDGREDYMQAVEALNGTRGQQNLPMALKLMEKAALQGHPRAIAYLGMMLFHGIGTESQKEKGLAFLYLGSQKNSDEARAMLKSLEPLLKPDGLNNARKIFEELKKPRVPTQPAVEQTSTKEPSKLEALMAKAKSGDAEAMYLISGIYARGEGVEVNPEEAKSFLKKAATGGHAKARDEIVKGIFATGIEKARSFQNQEAINIFKDGLKDYPDAFELQLGLAYGYNSLGLDHQEKEEGEAAEKAFRSGMETAQTLTSKHPKMAEGFLIFAMTTGNLAKFKGGQEKIKIGSKVEEYCKKAIELDPNLGMAHSVLATYYLAVVDLPWLLKSFAKTFLGKLPDATEEDVLKLYEAGVKASPDRVYTQLKYAQMLQRLSRKDEARASYLKVINLKPHRSEEGRNIEDAKSRLKELGG